MDDSNAKLLLPILKKQLALTDEVIAGKSSWLSVPAAKEYRADLLKQIATRESE